MKQDTALFNMDVWFMFENFSVSVISRNDSADSYNIVVDGCNTVLDKTGTDVWTSNDLPEGLSQRIGIRIEKG